MTGAPVSISSNKYVAIFAALTQSHGHLMNRSKLRKFLKGVTERADYQYVQLPGDASGEKELVLSRDAAIKLALASGSPHGVGLAIELADRFPSA